jgi:hemerythrin-like domain-containing protein
MKIKELFDADIESETVVRELEKSEQAVIDEVESTSKQLKERIEKEKTEIIENVKKHVAAEKERCNEQKSEINKRHELLRFGTEFCANVNLRRRLVV